MYIWDITGNKRLIPIRKKFIESSAGLVIVFDITNRQSFDDVQSWIDLIQNNDQKPLIVLVGNKIDLEEKRKVSKEEAESYAVQMDLHYFEISVKNNEGISEFMTYFITHLYHSRK